LGIHKEDGTIILRPDPDTIINKGEELIIVANDDSTIKFKKNACINPRDYNYIKKNIKRFSQRNLILGWHNIGGIIIREYANYLVKGSVIDIMIENPSDNIKMLIKKLKNKYQNLNISLIEASPMSVEDLKTVKPLTYNNVIILSQNEIDYNPERVDSDTLVILLLLRKIFKNLNADSNEISTKIITQVLNSENQELIQQSNADDFIISNKLISMFMAQLSQQPELFKFYDDIFNEEGSEIYLKPAILYFDQFPLKITFCDIIHAVQKREEICLGFRIKKIANDPEKNFGVKINPDKKEIIEIQKDDLFIVLAENEL